MHLFVVWYADFVLRLSPDSLKILFDVDQDCFIVEVGRLEVTSAKIVGILGPEHFAVVLLGFPQGRIAFAIAAPARFETPPLKAHEVITEFRT